MSTKPKRAEGRKGKDSRPQKHHQNGKPSAHSSNSTSINPLKSKIRDVRRLLEHSENLPPGVRIEKERALAGYKQDLEKAVEEKNKNQMISKYHMVRFFERQKATRNLKKLESRLAKSASRSGEEHEKLRSEIHAAKVDKNYAMYYPLTEKYISLFPRAEDSKKLKETVESNEGEKPPVWAFVEKCMESGTLEMLLEGKYNMKPDGSVKTREEVAPEIRTKKEDVREKTGAIKGNVQTGENNGGESDGGFFEE